MTFTLHVDTERWHKHLAGVLADLPGLVPVAKGNGYGLGIERLGVEASRLGVDTVAVGLPEEVEPLRSTYEGSVLVLTPYHPDAPDAPHDPHVIRTVSHLESLRRLAACRSRPRVVLELETSMRRHGLSGTDLEHVPNLLAGVTVEGAALHLPLAGSHLGETRAALARLRAGGVPSDVLWASRLSPGEVRRLAAEEPDLTVRPRIGTRLWLGDRGALRATGTVLDVKPLARGDRYGYRQRRSPVPGHLMVVSGGTAHGVGLTAPKAMAGLASRAKVVGIGGLEATGRALSPFRVDGRQRWFAEPPHMQLSMVLLPRDVDPPAIGDEIECEVRMTTTHFDRVVYH